MSIVTEFSRSSTGRSCSPGALFRALRHSVQPTRHRRICFIHKSATSRRILTRGGHTVIPIFGVPVAEAQQNYLDGKAQRWDLMAVTSEETTNDCLGQPWKNPTLIDITDDRAPWPIATLDVGQFPGDFCAKGSRFGVHELNREIYAPYYGKLLIVAMFNAGLQVWDIRDPYNPRRVAYFIQAPNKNTHESCGTLSGQFALLPEGDIFGSRRG